MKKKTVMSLLAVMSASMMLMSAGAFAAETEGTTEAATEISTEAESESESEAEELEDGVYSAEFDTDSGMFHANEACDGKGTLTVKDGKMTFHVSLASKNILNLFVGTAEDAQKDGAELLEPTTDTVTYKDGATEEVYGFDIPVEEVGKEFDRSYFRYPNSARSSTINSPIHDCPFFHLFFFLRFLPICLLFPPG